MSALGNKRRELSRMLPLLIQYAHFLGYETAVDFVKRCEDCPTGHQNSLHKLGLAVDLHLYLHGEYLADGSGHDRLHDFWDLLGGAERISWDLNHYSIEHGGMR